MQADSFRPTLTIKIAIHRDPANQIAIGHTIPRVPRGSSWFFVLWRLRWNTLSCRIYHGLHASM